MPKTPSVVISGMGPGGLASAWEAATRGKKVLILSDREDDFVRVQRVFLSVENREYLLSMLFKDKAPEPSSLNLLDKQFFNELVTSTTLGLKNLERFLKRRLDELPKGQISYQYQAQLSKVNWEEGSCSIESLKVDQGKEITTTNFDFLIGADGVNHHAADLVNEGREKPLFAYHTIESPKRAVHGSFYLTLEREDGEKLILPKKTIAGHVSGRRGRR